MVAIGVGGADAVDVMAGMPWELKFPKSLVWSSLVVWTVGRRLKMSSWRWQVSSRWKMAGAIVSTSVKVQKAWVLQVREPSVTWVLRSVQRLQHSVTTTACVAIWQRRSSNVVDTADAVAEHLTGDAEVYANPEQYFDQVIETNWTNWLHIWTDRFQRSRYTSCRWRRSCSERLANGYWVGLDRFMYQLFVRRFDACCLYRCWCSGERMAPRRSWVSTQVLSKCVTLRPWRFDRYVQQTRGNESSQC